MSALLVYTLKSAFVLTLLYLPYTLMLRRERFFRLNRMTLLTILVMSIIQPLCRVTTPDSLAQTSLLSDTQEIIHTTEAIILKSNVTHSWEWQEWLAFIYVVGVIIAVLLRLYQLFLIRSAICRGSLWQQKEVDGITIYCHVGDGAPFSWMHSIYINQHDYEKDNHAILLHERAHIACHHSFDILLLTIVEAIQWWNPFSYMLGQSLREIHEYQADNHVLHQGVSLHDYKTLLVRKALANTSFAFANNFNNSQVKKRIDMMKHPQSSPLMRGKVLYLLPVTLIVTAAFAMPKLNNQIEKVIEVIEPFQFIITEESNNNDIVEEEKRILLPKQEEQESDTNAVPLVEDVHQDDYYSLTPEYPGGMSVLRDYVQTCIAEKLQEDTSVAGKQVIIQFRVRKDGMIDDIGLLSGDDEAYHAAVKIVEQMPRWIPARTDNREVDSYFVLPVNFVNN